MFWKSLPPEDTNHPVVHAALAYKQAGYRPIPIRAGSKAARIDWKEYQHRQPTEEEIRSWYERWPSDGVGLIVGQYCSTLVADVDGEIGERSFAALGPEPRTLINVTGGGGRQFLFRHRGAVVKNRVGLVPGLDIRSDGGYCVVPPTRHPVTGREYRWQHAPDSAVDLCDAPQWLLDLLHEETTPSMAKASRELFSDTTGVNEGQRNDEATRWAGKLHGAGWSVAGTLARLRVLNAHRCQPPLDGAELTTIVTSIASRERAKGERAREPEAKNPPSRANLVLLSDVRPTPVEWLWQGYFPLGKVSLIMGDPGLGKSTMAVGLAAAVTTGKPFPDGETCEPGGVVLLTGEDSLGDTVRPRLEAAGGDSTRVLLIPSVTDSSGERPFSLPGDIGLLRDAILSVNARMVVIDPLSVYIASDLNSWHDQQVRVALTPLASIADEMRVAIVVITHLNKKQGSSAIYRAGGSIGIVAAVRAAFVIGKDPEDDRRRVMAAVKFNLGATPASRLFRIESAENGSSRVVWHGATDIRADMLLDQPKESQLDAAVAFLRDRLADGAQLVKLIEAQAEEAGISRRTLQRARTRLGVTARRSEFQGAVWIHLPTTEAPENTDLAINDDLLLSTFPGRETVDLGPSDGGEPYAATEDIDAGNHIDPDEYPEFDALPPGAGEDLDSDEEGTANAA